MKTLITRTLVILLAFSIGANAFGLFQPPVSAAAGPDLLVPQIVLSPPEPALDDTVTITVTVKNQGDAAAPGNVLTCYIDDSIIDNKYIDSIIAGTMETFTFTWRAAEGYHTIKATADSSGIIPETNENNNTGTYSFTTLAADLAVQSITWSPANPSNQDKVVFSITIKNQGTGKSNYSSVNFYIDSSTRGLQDVPAINPGETLIKTYTWTAALGQHTLKAVIDENNNTKESDEANNNLALTFTTLPADLTIQSIVWTPDNPSKNDTVQFTVTVKNQGAGRADSSFLGYYIDGDFMAAVPFPALNAGASGNVTIEWVADVDAHDIRTVADFYQGLNESSETNNELKVSLTTANPDLIISDLTWMPANAAAGDLVTFTVHLKNPGAGRAEASRAVFYLDGAVYKYIDFTAVEAGAEQTAEFTWTAESGSHAIGIQADCLEKTLESREDNNRYSSAIPVLASDLVVTAITFLPEKPAIDDTVTFTIIVANQGQGTATGFRLACYIDGNVEAVNTMPSIESDASANTTFSWKIQQGRHIFRALADYDNNVHETNEKNNSKTAEIAPAMPDLAVTNVTWSPPDFTAGQEISFAIDVENTGIIDAGASRIVFYVDDAIAGYDDIAPIDAGEKLTRNFTWMAAEGRHAITIVVDSKAQITEIDEDNNTLAVDIPPPDLIVLEIALSTQDVLSGDTVGVKTTFKNQGVNRAQSSAAALYADDLEISRITLPQIEAGDTYEGTFSWAAGPGAHTIKVRADVTNTVIETDETNNEIETVFSTMTADLSVSDISWLVDSQFSSNEATFTITMENSGSVASGVFSLEYWFDDAQSAVRQVESIPAGRTAEFTFTTILSEGQHTANIILDAQHEVSELNEDDNENAISFSTTAPDLMVRSISWAPLTAAAGDTVTISAKIENRGGEKAIDTRLSLAVDGTEIGFDDIPEIAAGATGTAEFSWTAAAGDHEILVLADSGRTIQESNETNNTRSRTISFAGGDEPVKKNQPISVNATTGGGLLESWWWLLLMVGGVLGLGMLYSTVKNMRKK